MTLKSQYKGPLAGLQVVDFGHYDEIYQLIRVKVCYEYSRNMK